MKTYKYRNHPLWRVLDQHNGVSVLVALLLWSLGGLVHALSGKGHVLTECGMALFAHAFLLNLPLQFWILGQERKEDEW
jgi:hypothetical protein